ncbi:MAG: S8 family serine peptidase [Planctomycetota bacterium]
MSPVVFWGSHAAALDVSQARIDADDAIAGFGNATGVIVGVIDNGVDVNHPALAGNDSQGQPRLVAQADFATDNWNSTDDSTGHGTGVAGIALSADATHFGTASDARYVNARVSDTFLTSTTTTVINGLDFAHANGAQIFNLSLNEPAGGSDDGTSLLSRAADHYVAAQNTPVVVSAGNFGANPDTAPTSPGDGYNVITVGGTAGPTYDLFYGFSARGPLSDGRSKPDVVAPAANITAPSRLWEGPNADFFDQDGTSFAAPHVTGLLAAQIGYGQQQGLSTDPAVLKATLINSAEKINIGSVPWFPNAEFTGLGVKSVVQPLNRFVGAGQVNGANLVDQYAAGEFDPGVVDPTGWDLNALDVGGTLEYELGHAAAPGGTLTATLAFERSVERIDDGDGQLDADDLFAASALANFNLQILRDDTLIAESVSANDSVEHLYLTDLDAGRYTLRVTRVSNNNNTPGESVAVAWNALGLTPFALGDLDLDGNVDVTDLDLLFAASGGPAPESWFDLTDDDTLDTADLDAMVTSILATDYGDATLNGVIDTGDLAVLASNFGQPVGSWAQGDFTGDGLVSTGDLAILASNFGFGAGPATASVAVPEPATLSVALSTALLATRRRHGMG